MGRRVSLINTEVREMNKYFTTIEKSHVYKRSAFSMYNLFG